MLSDGDKRNKTVVQLCFEHNGETPRCNYTKPFKSQTKDDTKKANLYQIYLKDT